ncbi:MAG: GNAT family N-acetyltransferase [Chryseolinea sp.]
MEKVRIIEATRNNSDVIGSLHAASWRIAYRGLLTDAYLDNDLEGERKKYWANKMLTLKPNEFVLLAVADSVVVGFISIMDVPEKGYNALVDNLHVTPHLKGLGVGATMMRAAARRLKVAGTTKFYLWVLEGNVAAEKFYLAKFGRPMDRAESDFGGKMVWATRYVWDSFDSLLGQGDEIA